MKTDCQIYVKDSIEAVAFYKRALNLTLGMTALNEDGTYEHASLMSGEDVILCVAESHATSPEIQEGKLPVMSFNCFDLGSREAVDQAYNVLSMGARSIETPDGPVSWPWNEYCFDLVDKFGVHWWIAI